MFLFGALHGRRRGLDSNLELLYVAAMFHDLGLTARYRTSSQRFEVDGADAARDFLLERGVDQGDADKVWLGIALHTTPEVPARLQPEIALLAAGVKTDVVGVELDAFSPEVVAAGDLRPLTAGFQEADPGGIQRRHEASPQSIFGRMNVR